MGIFISGCSRQSAASTSASPAGMQTSSLNQNPDLYIFQSQSLFEQLCSLMREEQKRQTVLEFYECLQKTLEDQLERAQKQLDLKQTMLETNIISAQNGSLDFLQSADLESLAIEVRDQKSEITELSAALARVLDCQIDLEDVIASLQEEQEDIIRQQEALKDLYNIPEFLEEGEADMEGMIDESVKIPEYSDPDIDINAGGIAGKYTFGQACVAADVSGILGSDYSDIELNLSSSDFILPVDGVVSAGTWAYPSGGMHLGLDLAASLYTPVKAPAAGIIVYASAPVDSNCGYLGNYCGWPYGGGNTIAMLCPIGDTVYAVTFAHLSNRFYVAAGQHVKQNDIIALSGNSGNSTGPHTHIEVFRLSVSLEQAISYFQSSGGDFAFGCGWSAGGTCSSIGCRIRPESVFL